MSELLDASLQFPTVVYTIILGIVLVYWAFVLLGALDIDLFGGDADVDVTGAAKGVGEMLHTHADGSVHAGAHGDADGDLDGDGGGLWHGLGLGDVPLTISLSLIAVTAWVGSLLAAHYVFGGALWQRLLVFGLAFVVAMPIAALLARPLAPIFKLREGKSNTDYVGHACTVTTGSVSDAFGQATIEDGGTVLVIQVRCDKPGALGRGDKALVIDFDPARQAYLVEPSADMLGAGVVPSV